MWKNTWYQKEYVSVKKINCTFGHFSHTAFFRSRAGYHIFRKVVLLRMIPRDEWLKAGRVQWHGILHWWIQS